MARGVPWHQLLISAAVLLVGLGLSALGSKQLLDLARGREQRAIEEQASSKAEQAQIALNRTLESLGSIRAFHDAHGSFSAESFSRFVKSDAAFHAGTLALGWVPRVTDAQRQAFERGLQPVVGRTASIFEVNWHGLLASSPVRPDYFPVQYLVSLTDGELVQGMNLAAMSWLSHPLEESIESGRTALVLRPRAATGSTNDFVIQAFMPVFRQRASGETSVGRDGVAGFAMGVFDVSSIFGSIFDAASDPYNVAVYALSRSGQPRRIFVLAQQGDRIEDDAGGGAWQREFQVADQTWRATFEPRRAGSRTYWVAYAGLAAGMAITTLLAGYLFLAQWRTAQVLRLSRSLRDTERRLFDERVAAAVQARLREQAQASEIAKTRLLQAASHDLRQPLHALGLYLGHALADDASGAPPSRWLQAMQQAFESLLQMFDGLLDWSRLESGRLQPHPTVIDIDAMLARLAAEYAAQARGRGLGFTLRSVSTRVATDGVLLERVLRNLLANAVRYTECGVVTLSARLRGDEVVVRVADTGIGIAADERARLFGAFERGRQCRDRHDGLGLGLAIAAQTTALLGHRLRLTSRIGRGTIVSVVIPRVASMPVERPVLPVAADGIAGRRLLVVEDDAAQRMQLAGLLEQWGAQVVTAPGLKAARQYLGDAAFDALIVDQHLGDGSGVALLDALPLDAARPATLLVTGDVSSIESIRARHPTVLVLAKPVSPLRLRSVLHYLLTSRLALETPVVGIDRAAG